MLDEDRREPKLASRAGDDRGPPVVDGVRQEIAILIQRDRHLAQAVVHRSVERARAFEGFHIEVAFGRRDAHVQVGAPEGGLETHRVRFRQDLEEEERVDLLVERARDRGEQDVGGPARVRGRVKQRQRSKKERRGAVATVLLVRGRGRGAVSLLLEEADQELQRGQRTGRALGCGTDPLDRALHARAVDAVLGEAGLEVGAGFKRTRAGLEVARPLSGPVGVADATGDVTLPRKDDLLFQPRDARRLPDAHASPPVGATWRKRERSGDKTQVDLRQKAAYLEVRLGV